MSKHRNEWTTVDVHRDQHTRLKALADAHGLRVWEMTAELLDGALDLYETEARDSAKTD